jgi:hypothetical protein
MFKVQSSKYKLLFSLLAAVLLTACGTEKGRFRLEGRLRHMNQAEFLIYSPDGGIVGMDTIKVQEGRFSYETEVRDRATFVLIFCILAIGNKENTPELGMGSLGAFPVAFLIISIGMSLGGTTGYALNPARDLGPRLAHCLLPIKGKRDSDWAYSWIPALGPIIGAALAAGLYLIVY